MSPDLSRRGFLTVGSLAAAGLALAACTPAGEIVITSSAALADLAAKLNGRLLLPGETGFTDAGAPTNGHFRDIVPMAVARVADEADVVTAVNWAREHGMPFAVRGGGHSYAALSATTGLVIDLSRMNAVHVDRAAWRITTGGAASNGDIFNATELGGEFLPGGTCLGVGIGGLALGGGIGYHARWAGLTGDHLVRARMVTATGEIVEASATEHPDLFWALRGGTGGTFGVCTELEFDMVEVPADDVIFYRFDWTGADAAAHMFAAVDALEQDSPPEFVASCMAQPTPLAADGDQRAAVSVMLRGQFLGSRDDFMGHIAPVLDGNPPAKQTIVEQPWWPTARGFTSQEAEVHGWGDVSRYTDRALPSAAIEQLVDLVAECPERGDATHGELWMLGWVGGAVIDRFARTETAYVHRGMKSMVRPSPVWSDRASADQVRDLEDWTDAVLAVLEPHTPRESYQNFPNRRLVDWQEQYYAENLERLIDVKTEWDPDNLFTSAQTIAPRGA